MLTTIEATYENGQIIWSEQSPVQEKRNVLLSSYGHLDDLQRYI